MKKYFILLHICLLTAVFAQADYTMKLTNPIQLAENSLSFDITIHSNSTDFRLTSYQCSFSFDLNLGSNDSISLIYIDNSSALSNFPLNILGYDSIDGINEMIFVSGIGNDLISNEEISVGKFSITSTMDLTLDDLNLKWNFGGSMSTILTGENFVDITDSTKHFGFDSNITEFENELKIPVEFELKQNYPNPFNPSTKIKYSIPEQSKVRLEVFDILGREVVILVNIEQSQGNYEVEFSPSAYGLSLASGVYFYRLQVGDPSTSTGQKFVGIKKMMFLK